jgi:predicted HNH restriction endonuclease
MSHVRELRCDVCGFSFNAVYGEIGENYIEAHHLVPVSEMREGDETGIEDIALVCSNCHRMIHRKTPCYSIKGLKIAITDKIQES